ITTFFGSRRSTSAISRRFSSIGRSEMSSILLNPIIRRPSQSMDEYLELTFGMGSPIVFHTAPPQPASNARITCSPQLVGGPDASQTGFGLRMPAKLVVRSAMFRFQLSRDRQRRAFPVCHCVHHFAPAVHT